MEHSSLNKRGLKVYPMVTPQSTTEKLLVSSLGVLLVVLALLA
jgi:hypothetical protein